MRYYSASFIFAVGVGLLILGLTLMLTFQLHYGSEPFKVEITFGLIGISIPIIVHGINMMLGYRRYSMFVTILGFILSLSAVGAFITLYPENWYYPNITYVAVVYALGLIMLFSSSFAEAVVRIIESSAKTIKKIVIHERGEVAKKSEEELPPLEAKFAFPTKVEEPEIALKDITIPSDLKPGKALEKPRIGKMVKVRDEVDSNAERLIRVREGELKVKKTDSDILEVTKALKSIEERMGKEDKKKIFGG